MVSPTHEQYRARLHGWLLSNWADPQVSEAVRRFLGALLVLWHLDLEPAREILTQCYAPNPRGGKPKDPVAMLRALLAMILVEQPSINKWVPQARSVALLALLAGFEPGDFPGVGTLYDFLNRLNDGPIRNSCEHVVQPSVDERRRAKTPRPPRRKAEAKATKATKERGNRGRKRRGGRRRKPADPDAETAVAREVGVTQKLVDQLLATAHQGLPEDLVTRLGRLLLHVAVVPSANKGLLGDIVRLVVGGDGSSLVTGAQPNGRRTCSCPRSKRCDCPRIYSDPDAAWGYDSYRKTYFYGHRFYELSTSTAGHDLPLHVEVGPGNETDFTLGVKTLDRARKLLAEVGSNVDLFIADAGHDAEPVYQLCLHHDIKPVIPLAQEAPAELADRGLRLSPRGVPLCQGGAEMASNGSAGAKRQVFICPVKSGKLRTCPLAPADESDWVCRPDLKWGPTVVVRTKADPRLTPPIARNSQRYRQLYNLRSGTERSNSVKKQAFNLEAARHRRQSFWLIRVTLMAILQHAKAWVADMDADGWLRDLLGAETALAA
jgi:hypothetical protein